MNLDEEAIEFERLATAAIRARGGDEGEVRAMMKISKWLGGEGTMGPEEFVSICENYPFLEDAVMKTMAGALNRLPPSLALATVIKATILAHGLE